MATITADTSDTPQTRTRPRLRWPGRARDALTSAGRQGAAMASAARHRYRRPALVIGSFTCGDIAAFHTYGTGAGLLAVCVTGLVLEMLGGDE